MTHGWFVGYPAWLRAGLIAAIIQALVYCTLFTLTTVLGYLWLIICCPLNIVFFMVLIPMFVTSQYFAPLTLIGVFPSAGPHDVNPIFWLRGGSVLAIAVGLLLYCAISFVLASLGSAIRAGGLKKLGV